jgi:hypothetical protein
MPAKPNARNWNDVQTAIATVAIVTTLGLWNLFATPSKAEAAQSTDQPVPPPAEEPPPVAEAATAMPQVKIMFTQIPSQPSQTTFVQQPQEKKKKKKNNDNQNNNGGSVTTTQSS